MREKHGTRATKKAAVTSIRLMRLSVSGGSGFRSVDWEKKANMRLGREDIRRVLDIQLRGLRQLLAGRKLGLEVSEQAAEILAREGYDPDFGARPLARVIQNRLQNPIAEKILEGTYQDGDVVKVGAKYGELVLK